MNEYIVKRIPIPIRDFASDPRLIVIRSFDVNKPGAEVDDLKGGVAGGSILTGVLRLGQEVEIRPGIVTKDSAGRNKCKPIFSRIMSLHAENNLLQFAVPGGLIGVGTRIDPTLCRADRLVGQVLGAVGKLPKIYTGGSFVNAHFPSLIHDLCIELEISLFLLRRLLGVKTEDKKQTRVSKLVKNELLLINIGSTSTGGRVLSVKADLAKIQLTSPACTEVGEKVALSRRIEKHWRLVGEYAPCRSSVIPYSRLYRMGKCATGHCTGSRLISGMFVESIRVIYGPCHLRFRVEKLNYYILADLKPWTFPRKIMETLPNSDEGANNVVDSGMSTYVIDRSTSHE